MNRATREILNDRREMFELIRSGEISRFEHRKPKEVVPR